MLVIAETKDDMFKDEILLPTTTTEPPELHRLSTLVETHEIAAIPYADEGKEPVSVIITLKPTESKDIIFEPKSTGVVQKITEASKVTPANRDVKGQAAHGLVEEHSLKSADTQKRVVVPPPGSGVPRLAGAAPSFWILIISVMLLISRAGSFNLPVM